MLIVVPIGINFPVGNNVTKPIPQHFFEKKQLKMQQIKNTFLVFQQKVSSTALNVSMTFPISKIKSTHYLKLGNK